MEEKPERTLSVPQGTLLRIAKVALPHATPATNAHPFFFFIAGFVILDCPHVQKSALSVPS